MKTWQRLWRHYQSTPLAQVSILVLFSIILAILVGPFFYKTSSQGINFANSVSPPSWSHPLGTNTLGQDQLARILSGGRISLTVGLAAMLVSITIGTSIGAVAGFYGGRIDQGLMSIVDIFLALPGLPLLLLVIYLFKDLARTIAGPSLGIFGLIVLVIGGLNWMSVARLVRGNFLRLREMDFVEAAKANGASPRRIIIVHLLSNTWSAIIVAATIAVGNAIITESTLSFLGLGFPPDVPTWGRLLFEAKDYLTSAPYLAIFPGLAMLITVLSINSLGEGIKEALDPKSSNLFSKSYGSKSVH